MGWALNAAHILMKKIQETDKTVSLSVSKLKMIDNKNKVYAVSSPIAGGEAPVIEKTQRIAYISQVVKQPYYRWTTDGDTITDHVTELMWMPISYIEKETYANAKIFLKLFSIF